ncbi:hypothetical protein UFOVP307_22 [uncultured Caudovirales phage]|uniref:Uncharacterized protein n=1 Tax=uncultured Caudovirales phage TaxID=2100421 RepID=A0A6J5LUU2_9CAUD|nr:hypothetical protein UFOVP307_22 [uncultured Caudovirales phage]
MAEFDPDAYLGKTTEFDPNKYLGVKPQESDETARLAARYPAPLSEQIPGYGKPVPAARNQPNLSTGQLAYRNIARPVIAPTVEAMGAVGGGLLGTPIGPAGIVGGAGLGYGMAKEALKLGDIYLGGMTPEEAQTQPVKNVLEGATYEAGGRVVAPMISKGIGKAIDVFNAPVQKAASLAQLSLGKDLPEVLAALRSAPPNASVAELTASVNNPKWQALIDDALQQDPQFLRKVKLFNEEDSLKALSKLAGGENAAEVRSVAERAKDALNAITTPSRETSLNRANLGKAVAEYEAKAGMLSGEAAAKVADVRRLIEAGELAEAAGRLELIKKGIPVGFTRYTYKGDLALMADNWAAKAADASLDLGQGARFAQGAADALRSVGIKPLEGAALSQRISSIANNPKFAGDDVLVGAVKNVADDIAKWTNNGGVVDAVALDAIRKNSVNAAIQKLRPGIDATSQRNLASTVLGNIRPLIIDAIEEAGGKGYRQYLTDYTKGMEKIAERKLTGEALKLWKTNKDGFVRLVQNETPEEVERILGPGKYNIATELADSSMTVLRSEANKRLTQIAVGEQISEGQAALSQLLKQQTSFIRFPSYLSVLASSTNKVISELERAVGQKTLQTLTQAMKTPQGAADLLSTLPAAERNQVLRILSDPSQWSPTISTSTTFGLKNALTTE